MNDQKLNTLRFNAYDFIGAYCIPKEGGDVDCELVVKIKGGLENRFTFKRADVCISLVDYINKMVADGDFYGPIKILNLSDLVNNPEKNASIIGQLNGKRIGSFSMMEYYIKQEVPQKCYQVGVKFIGGGIESYSFLKSQLRDSLYKKILHGTLNDELIQISY